MTTDIYEAEKKSFEMTRTPWTVQGFGLMEWPMFSRGHIVVQKADDEIGA